MNQGFPVGLLARERIARGGVEWSGALPGLDVGATDGQGARLAEPARVSLRVEPAGGDALRAHVRIEGVAGLTCRRCLAGIRVPLDLALPLRFDPEVARHEEGEGLYALDPGATELDLMPALREELLLALPAFPLCRPDCRGLCPTCGADRNEGDCGCRGREPDPRWRALRNVVPGAATAGEDGSRPDNER